MLDLPIIGYNVIEKITQNSVDNFEQPPYLDVLSSSFVGVDRGNIELLVDFIRAEKPTELSEIKTTKKDTVIPPNQSVRVSCHVSIGPIAERTPVLFEPNHGHGPVLKFQKRLRQFQQDQGSTSKSITQPNIQLF